MIITAAYFCPEKHRSNPESTRFYRHPCAPDLAAFKVNIFLQVKSAENDCLGLVRENNPEAVFVGRIFAPHTSLTVKIDYHYYDAPHLPEPQELPLSAKTSDTAYEVDRPPIRKPGPRLVSVNGKLCADEYKL